MSTILNCFSMPAGWGTGRVRRDGGKPAPGRRTSGPGERRRLTHGEPGCPSLRGLENEVGRLRQMQGVSGPNSTCVREARSNAADGVSCTSRFSTGFAMLCGGRQTGNTPPQTRQPGPADAAEARRAPVRTPGSPDSSVHYSPFTLDSHPPPSTIRPASRRTPVPATDPVPGECPWSPAPP